MIILPILAMIATGEPIVQLLRDPDSDRSIFYKFALRLLLGMAGLTIFFLLMDFTGIPISRLSILVSSFTAGALSLAVRVIVHRQKPPRIRGWKSGDLQRISWPCLFTTLLLASLVAASFFQMTYLVPQAYDALVGWDLVAKIMSHEGVYRSSVYENINFNAQATYPPFTACMQGLCYLFTPETARIWIPILLLGFMIVFGEEIWRRTRSSLLSSFLLLLVFTAPELNFHLTVAQTDLPNMVFVSLAFVWILAYPNDRRSVPLAAVFMFIAMMTRSETVLIAAAAVLWMWIRVLFRRGSSQWSTQESLRGSSRRPRRWALPWSQMLPPLWILFPCVAFFAFWNLFYVRELLGYNPTDHFRTALDIDPARAWTVIRYAVIIIMDKNTFGELWWLFLGGIGAWILWIVWGRRIAGKTPQALNDLLAPGTVLALFFLTILFYLPFFYQWDPVLNPLWTMEHTFKRGFFRYVPLIMLFVLSVVRLWWVAIEIRYLKKS